MRAVICGVGRMGTAIAWAMDKLGFDLTGMDTNPDAANNIPSSSNNLFFIVDDAEDITRGLSAQEKPDVVISSLPYHQTETVGLWCIANGVRYCDLGGRVDVSERINSMAKDFASKPVFTDLGLAPGWVNILAEQGFLELHGGGQIIKVEMMVGGLPSYLESNSNPLRYGVTWSVDGLINEYRDDCLILENGQITKVKGMDGLESLETKSLGKMEAFYTSGGASHSIHSMRRRGVNNCCYKTIRYGGHRNIVKFLIEDCGLDDESLNKIFQDGCGRPNKDEVIIVAKVYKDNKTWHEEKLIKSDERFSAMQKATAFPASCVASIMAEGKLEGDKGQHRDYYTQYSNVSTYADVPLDLFNKRLDILGVYD